MASKKTSKPETTSIVKVGEGNDEFKGSCNLTKPIIFFEFDPQVPRETQLLTFVKEHLDFDKKTWIMFINILPADPDFELVYNERNAYFNKEERSITMNLVAVENNVVNTTMIINAIALIFGSFDEVIDEVVILTRSISAVKNKSDVKNLFLYVEQGALIGGYLPTTIIQEIYKRKPDLMVSDLEDDEKVTKKKKDKKKSKKKKGKK